MFAGSVQGYLDLVSLFLFSFSPLDPWFVSCSWFYFIGAFSPVAFQYNFIDLKTCMHTHPLPRPTI
jgi:hypothetical protein